LTLPLILSTVLLIRQSPLTACTLGCADTAWFASCVALHGIERDDVSDLAG
jgi:hypothetical protein